MALQQNRATETDEFELHGDEKRARSHSTPPSGNTSEDKVTISLGEIGTDDLQFAWGDLSRVSTYFQAFDQGLVTSRQFHLVPASGRVTGLLVPNDDSHSQHTVAKELTDINSSTDKDMTYARQVHRALFSQLFLVERRDDDTPVQAVLVGVTQLAAQYGCTKHVRSDILLRLHNRNEKGIDLFQEKPFDALEIASCLQDKSAFLTALRHAAGQRAAGMIDARSLPDGLATIVETEAATIKRTVETTTITLSSPVPHGGFDFPHWIAHALFQHHVMSKICPQAPGSQQRYRELRYLLGLRSGGDLMDSTANSVLSAIRDIDRGLVSGSNLRSWFEHDKYGNVPESHFADIEISLERNFNTRSVRRMLETILHNARSKLKPLFRGDVDAGYFTCLSPTVRVPWNKE